MYKKWRNGNDEIHCLICGCNIVKPVRGMSIDSMLFIDTCTYRLYIALTRPQEMRNFLYSFIDQLTSESNRIEYSLSLCFSTFSFAFLIQFYRLRVPQKIDQWKPNEKYIMKYVFIYDTMNYPSYIEYAVNLYYCIEIRHQQQDQRDCKQRVFTF